MSYCSNCGKELKENYKFCPRCGKELVVNIVNEDEKLYDEVVKFVIENNKASASLIQNEFNVSYNKASKLIKLLEERGVVGPQNGNKPREVLTNKEENNEDEKEESKIEENINAGIESILDTPDTTSCYDNKDIKDNLVLSILSYLGLLVFIPYFAHNNSKFVKYHATQGMNLLIVWVGYTLLDNLLGLIKVSKVVVNFGSITGTRLVTPVWVILPMTILGIILFVLSVVGIVYVCQGKAKELPVVGKIKIVK